MILKNCRLVLELCEDVENQMADIRVEGNTIAEILPAGGTYENEEVIDCTGKTVLPGLFNVHSHFWFNELDENRLLRKQTEYSHIENCLAYMNALLSYGFTSIRDVGGPYNIAINFRDSINAGRMIGPDIKASGLILTPYLTPGAPIECYSHQFGRPVNNVDQIRTEVRREIHENHADFIKVIGTSLYPMPRVKGGFAPLFLPEELAELQKMAVLHDKYLAIHSVIEEINAAAIELGVRTIEHAWNLSDENVEQIVAKGMKTHLVPTLTVATLAGDDEAMVYALNKGLIKASEAGVVLGWGTDVGLELFLAKPEKEFELRSRVLGFSNVEILKQATIYSAIINETDDIRGSIKVGKRADFAIIDGNPDEDLSVFAHPCAYVLKDGQVVAQNGYVKGLL